MSCTNIMISSLSSWHASPDMHPTQMSGLITGTSQYFYLNRLHSSLHEVSSSMPQLSMYMIHLQPLHHRQLAQMSPNHILHNAFPFFLADVRYHLGATHTRDFARPFKYLIVGHSKGYASHTPTLMIYILCTPCHVSIYMTQLTLYTYYHGISGMLI